MVFKYTLCHIIEYRKYKLSVYKLSIYDIYDIYDIYTSFVD